MYDATYQHYLLHERSESVTELAQYVLSLAAVAILCGIVHMILGKGSVASPLVKIITGTIMTVTVFNPLMKLEFDQIPNYIESIKVMGQDAIEMGESSSEDLLADIIKEKTQTYIMDRASALGIALEADVKLSEDNPPIPESVVLAGTISPYAKQQLAHILQTELGIPKERQTWI